MDRITLICGTRYLHFDRNSVVTINPFELLYSKAIVSEWRSDSKAMSYFGLISTLDYVNNPFFFCNKPHQDLFNRFQTSEIESVMELSNLMLGSFISSLWFVKDNCCNLSVLYLYDLLNDGAKYKYHFQSMSNSRGQFHDIEFSLGELKEANRLTEKLDALANFHRISPDEIKSKAEDKHGHISPAVISSKLYNHYNRVARAFLFLVMARSNSFLPLKISFYIAIYESLFTTEGTEVSHKVSERAAIYIGSTSIEKLDFFKTLKNAYNIRSKYVHGQELPKGFKTFDELAALSENIDSLTRKLFLKILDNDGVNFLKNDNELNDWFSQSLFQN